MVSNFSRVTHPILTPVQMSNKLKVEFIDNSESQYDEHAARIKYGEKGGKLYIGDRFAASYVQLKWRDCKTVISCDRDLHGFSKESDVNYLKIDPDDENNNHFEETYQFLDKNLAQKKNVVVHCETGLGKSAVILCYFLMKKMNISLAESYRILQDKRGGIRMPPRLVKMLMAVEVKARGICTISLDGKFIKTLDGGGLNFGKSSGSSKKNGKQNPNTGMYVGIGLVVFFAILYGGLVALTGKA